MNQVWRLGHYLFFYTGEFYNTIPVLFQFQFIYPFLLNPVITILFLPAFCYLLFLLTKRKHFDYAVLVSFFLLLFLSQAFFFVKWTRYMVPTLPFIYLIITIALVDLRKRIPKSVSYLSIVTVIFVVSSISSLSYFITAFVRPDTRVAAYQFARNTIPGDAPILSEIYDMGIVPFNNFFSNITLFHFYDLDNNSPTANDESLQQLLSASDYIVLPSQRILKTRLLHKQQFPNGYAFYQALLRGRLGYTKIYETPCDIFCKIIYLGTPIFSYEQTANVFDRPPVMIFKKQQ